MKMEAEMQDVVLVESLLTKINGIPILPSECRRLAEILKDLLPVLKAMRSPQAQVSNQTSKILSNLMPALQRTETVLDKVKQASTSKLKRVFLKRQLAAELRESTLDCLFWINKLPPFEKDQEIQGLQSKLEELGKSLNDNGTSGDEDDEDRFLAEVMEVLRAHNSGEAATTSAEGGKAIEGLLQLLARRFDSDVTTVLREWKEIKEETEQLKKTVEYTAENKRLMERDFMQVLLYLDKGIQQEETEAAAASSSNSDKSPPDEYNCSICKNLMEYAVVCASGHSYCRDCLGKWFEEGNDTCPLTRTKVSSDFYDNFALRKLIARWKEDTALRRQQQQDEQVSGEPLPRLTIEVPPEPVDEPPDNMRTGRFSNSEPPTTPSVAPHIASLRSPSSSPRKVRSSLIELVSIAQDPSGQWEIHTEDGIFVLKRYLSSDDPFIAGKAADVFENLTFQPRKGNDHLRYDQREAILASVTEHALDSLIHQMHFGNSSTRFAAARTVVNLLEDDQAREKVRHKEGVVQGLVWVGNICTDTVFECSQDGINSCKKGLALLAGAKPPIPGNPYTNRDLSTALLRVAGSSTANRKLLEETLGVLSSMVKGAGPLEIGTWLDKDGIKTLIALFHRPESLPLGRRSVSRPSSLTEGAKREILNIFDEICKGEGFLKLLVECELVRHLLSRITQADAGKDFVCQGVKLLWRCIQACEQKYFQSDFQLEMKGVVAILLRNHIPDEAKLDLLSALVHLCEWRNGDPLRESFDNTCKSFLISGVAALGILAESSLEAVREKTAVMFRLIAQSDPCHKVLRTPEADELLADLLADEADQCRYEAVIALASTADNRDWDRLLQHVTVEQIVAILLTTPSSDCCKAAISVLGKICKKHSGASGNPHLPVILREEETINGLMHIIRFPDGRDEEAFEAAELLMSLIERDHNICPFLLEENKESGLSVLIKIGVKPGNHFRRNIVRVFRAFAEVSVDTKGALMDVGGVALLVKAVEEGRNTADPCTASTASDAVRALEALINYEPAKEAVIEAGFAEVAIRCLAVRTLSYGLLNLLHRILDREATVEKRRATAERIRKARGVEALVGVLSTHGAGLKDKKLVSKILTRLIQLDKEVKPILRKEKGMEHLNNLLRIQAADETTPSNDSRWGEEVLETLNAATEDEESLKLLLNEQCIKQLLSLMGKHSLCPKVEGLALDLLLKLSRVASSSSTDFMVPEVSEQLLRVIDNAADDSLVENAARIIRNISLFGPAEREIMRARGAVKVLLRRISTCPTQEPDVNFSVVALERFMFDEVGRKTFIQENGIPILVNFLSKSRYQARLFATRILVLLASKHSNATDWFTKIWDAKLRGVLLLSLRDSLEKYEKDCKIQAAELLKTLILKSGGAEVRKFIKDTGCYSTLRTLQTPDPECKRYVNEALEAYKKNTRVHVFG